MGLLAGARLLLNFLVLLCGCSGVKASASFLGAVAAAVVTAEVTSVFSYWIREATS
jgi:hypothetical protein